jgi:hypothetical protein
MTTFVQNRATVESFVDCMHGGADKDVLARVLAENVVLISPLSDEPLTGREAVTAAIQGVSTVAADLTYKEVLSGENHHAAFFRLQIEDTAVKRDGLRPARRGRQDCRGDHILAPAAVRRRNAGSPRASRRHAALGNAHQGRVTITGCPRPMSLT